MADTATSGAPAGAPPAAVPELIVRAQALVTAAATIDDGWVAIAAGTVCATGSGRLPAGWEGVPVQRCEGALLPGFIDPHVHGAIGHDFATASADEVRETVAFFATRGSTSLMATVATGPLTETLAAIERLRPLVQDGTLLGIHLEGPYLSFAHRGAHAPELLRTPMLGELDELLAAGDGTVRVVTIAPELPGAIAAVEHLAQSGVIVALGHSDCDAATANRAVTAGARVVTHLFNGMRPLHHRDPGLAGVGLTDSRLTVELIVDAHHVDPVMVQLTRTAAGSRMMLVSDAMAATGCPDGHYRVGGSDVVVHDQTAMLADGTSLAGSTTVLAAEVQRLRAAGAGLGELARVAGGQAAQLLGLEPPLSAGTSADLVLLRPADGTLTAVMKHGAWVFPERNLP